MLLISVFKYYILMGIRISFGFFEIGKSIYFKSDDLSPQGQPQISQ